MGYQLRSVLLIASLFFFTLSAFTQAHVHNGYWWKDLERTAKTSYVIGFADGSAEADEAWAYLQRKSKVKMLPDHQSAVRGNNDYSNVSYGQLVDGLDEFFKDYKNTQIHVYKAIFVIKEQIKGLDQKAVDDYILFLRKDAADPEYDKN